MKNRSAETISTYIDSPLGQALSKVLGKFEAYAAAEFPDTAEGLYTSDMISELKDLLTILHRKLLPKFDNKKIPSVKKNLISVKIGIKIASLIKNQRKFSSKELRICLNLEELLPDIIKKAVRNHKSKKITEKVFDEIKSRMKEALKSAKHIKIKDKDLDLDPNNKIIKNLEKIIDNIGYDKESAENLNHKEFSKALIKFLDIEIFAYHADNNLPPISIYILNEESYKLFISLFDIYKELPKKIHEMAPFFNPEFIYKKLGRIIEKHFGKKGYKFAKKENTADNAFVYYLTTPDDAFENYVTTPMRTNKIEINANKEYEEFQDIFFNTLVPKYLSEYFNDYAGTFHVKSEVAKGKMLKKVITEYENDFKKDYFSQAGISIYPPIKTIEGYINAFSSATEKLEEATKQLGEVNNAKKKISDYVERVNSCQNNLADKNCTIRQFIGDKAADDLSKAGENKGYSTTFLNETLPSICVLVKEHKEQDKDTVLIETYQIREKFSPLISAALAQANSIDKALTTKKDHLEKLKSELTNQWLKEQNENLLKRNNEFSEAIKRLTISGSDMSRTSTSLRKDIDELKSILNQLTLLYEEAHSSRKKYGIKRKDFIGLRELKKSKIETKKFLSKLEQTLKDLEEKEPLGNINKIKHIIEQKQKNIDLDKTITEHDNLQKDIEKLNKILNFLQRISNKINENQSKSDNEAGISKFLNSLKKQKESFEKNFQKLKKEFHQEQDYQEHLLACEQAIRFHLETSSELIKKRIDSVILSFKNRLTQLISAAKDKLDKNTPTDSDQIELNNLKNDLQHFKDNVSKFQDLIPNAPVKINEINSLLTLLDDSAQIHGKIDLLIEDRHGLETELSKKIQINQIVSSCKTMLDGYLTIREDFKSHPLLKGDLEITQKAILDISNLITAYSKTGDASSIANFVSEFRNKQENFGKNLIPLFDEILHKISNGVDKSESDPILKNNSFTDLVSKIDQMHNYGLNLICSKKTSDKAIGWVAIDLADELKAEIREFSKIPEVKLSNEFPKFKKRFTDVLHSRDHIMAQHRARWKIIIANVAIALTGLGALVLGGYSIHALATRRHPFIFFDRTNRQKQINQINKSLNRIKPGKPH